jgi:hypothetical protein
MAPLARYASGNVAIPNKRGRSSFRSSAQSAGTAKNVSTSNRTHGSSPATTPAAKGKRRAHRR